MVGVCVLMKMRKLRAATWVAVIPCAGQEDRSGGTSERMSKCGGAFGSDEALESCLLISMLCGRQKFHAVGASEPFPPGDDGAVCSHTPGMVSYRHVAPHLHRSCCFPGFPEEHVNDHVSQILGGGGCEVGECDVRHV